LLGDACTDDASKVIPPDDPCTGDRRRDAIAVVNGFLQVYEGYHTRKEEMAWLATALYLGGTAFLLGREPFWQCWPIRWLVAWLALLVFTAVAAGWLVWWQFDNRHRAAAFLEACHATLAHWLRAGVTLGDLDPTPLPEMGDIRVPARLAREFRYRGTLGTLQGLTLVLMALWTVAAGIYVVLTYTGP
jgi:hypothetical protein